MKDKKIIIEDVELGEVEMIPADATDEEIVEIENKVANQIKGVEVISENVNNINESNEELEND